MNTREERQSMEQAQRNFAAGRHFWCATIWVHAGSFVAVVIPDLQIEKKLVYARQDGILRQTVPQILCQLGLRRTDSDMLP